MSRTTTREVSSRRLGVVAAAIACLTLVTACSTPDTEASGDADHSNPEVVAAQALLKKGNESLLYGPTEGSVDPGDLRPLTEADIHVHDWSGDAKGKRIFIVQGNGANPALIHQVNLAKAWLKKLGFEVRVAAGDFTPAGDQRVMDLALQWNPDAIYDISVLPVNIGAQLAEAKKRGIPVVYTVGTENNTPGEFAAWVSQSTNLSMLLFGAQLIVESGATANVMSVRAKLFPEIESPVAEKYIKDNCKECEVKSFDATNQFHDPVAMASLTTSLIRSNPKMTYFALPAACVPVSAAIQAAKQLGDVKVESTGCPATAAQMVRNGEISGVTGVVEPMSVLGGIDQILRMLDGEDPLPSEQTGPAAFYFDKDSMPEGKLDGNFGPIDRWALERFDYLKPYEKVWGIDLHSEIEKQK